MTVKKHLCSLNLGSDSMLPKKGGLWCWICRTMRKLTLISHHHPDTYRYFRSYPAVVAERQRQLLEGGCGLIHRFSLFSLIWSSFMILVNLSHMIMSTIRLFYIIHPPGQIHIHTVDVVLLCLHVLCMIDIAVKFNVGCMENNMSNVVMDRNRIACRYLRSWFIPDLLSCLPVAFCLIYIEIKQPRYLLLAHILALLRNARIYTVMVDLKKFLKMFTRSYLCYEIVRLCVLFAMSVHWCSCSFYICPTFYLYWHNKVHNKYVHFLNMMNPVLTDYPFEVRFRKGTFVALTAFFGTSFSMYKLILPDEIILQALIVIYAGIFMIYCLVVLLKIYMTKYNSTMRYHELMNQVEEYMRHKQFPAPLKKRILAFYHYKYQEHYFKEDTALASLSEQLRNEITLYTCHKLVTKVGVFKELPASVVGSVLGCLKPEVYLANDLVVRAGDIGNCMYFIANGTVAVYSLKGVEVCHLDDGAHFGEVALLMKDSKRVATVVSVEITQVYRLDAVDFRNYVVPNQMLYERIAALASKRMHETVLLDDAYKRDRHEKISS